MRFAAASSLLFALFTLGYCNPSDPSVSMIADATITRVYHLLSAGTTYHGASLLERVDLAPLWVHARHDVLDGPVLSRRIQGLEDQEHGPAILGVEHVLELGQCLHTDLQRLGAAFRPRDGPSAIPRRST